MKLKLTDNLFLKILSVLVALVLWLVVINISDAETTAKYTLDVSMLNTDVITENGKVFRVEEGTDSVRVTVRARRSVIQDLKPTDFVLTADMEKDLKYDSMVGITIECRNKNIDIDEDVTLSRSNVLVSIEDSATEQFPIHVSYTGTPNEGLVVGSMVPEQTIIKITGPISIVERIKRVAAVVDVTGLPGTSVKNCSLKLYDGDDDLIDTTYLNFAGKGDGIDVTVSMLNTKTVPLIFSYTGTPAENYEVKNVDWKPELVEIAGSAGVLSGMTSLQIPAEVVNVEGIDEELQLVVDITPYLPSGVVLTDETGASVLVIVEVGLIEDEDEEESDKDSDSETEKPSQENQSSKPEKPSEDTTDKENTDDKETSKPDNSTDPDTGEDSPVEDSENSESDVTNDSDKKTDTSTGIESEANQNNQETENRENEKSESNS